MIELDWDETHDLPAEDSTSQEFAIGDLALGLMEVASSEGQYGHPDDDRFVNQWMAARRY